MEKTLQQIAEESGAQWLGGRAESAFQRMADALIEEIALALEKAGDDVGAQIAREMKLDRRS